MMALRPSPQNRHIVGRTNPKAHEAAGASLVLQNNWFFVENRFGGSRDIYLAERWFVRPSAVAGANTYPRATTFVNEDGQSVTEIVRDEFQIYGFSINYELRPDVVLSVGVDQQLRNSNLPRFDKDRTVFNIGVTAGF